MCAPKRDFGAPAAARISLRLQWPLVVVPVDPPAVAAHAHPPRLRPHGVNLGCWHIRLLTEEVTCALDDVLHACTLSAPAICSVPTLSRGPDSHQAAYRGANSSPDTLCLLARNSQMGRHYRMCSWSHTIRKRACCKGLRAWQLTSRLQLRALCACDRALVCVTTQYMPSHEIIIATGHGLWHPMHPVPCRDVSAFTGS